jgi:transmembrane 9 superfamily protein 2/4
VLALLALAAPGACAFYIPGAFPNAFAPNATLRVRVNALTSDEAELRLNFYSLPFCRPPGGPRRVAENLGELLAGDRIATSAYAARLAPPGAAAAADEPPALLCQTRLSADDADALRRSIDQNYRAQMFLDTLPVRFLL